MAGWFEEKHGTLLFKLAQTKVSPSSFWKNEILQTFSVFVLVCIDSSDVVILEVQTHLLSR